MHAHSLSRRIFVAALAALMLLCCCERRIFADTLLGAVRGGDAACAVAEPAAPACCARCAAPAEGDRNEERGDAPEPPCCGDGCCDKAAAPALEFSLAVDCIGVALPAPASPVRTEPSAVVPRESRDGRCRPPPWRVLIETARLRI